MKLVSMVDWKVVKLVGIMVSDSAVEMVYKMVDLTVVKLVEMMASDWAVEMVD